jgi:hypothetical protein
MSHGMDKRSVFLMLLMATSLQACAIERHDVLECGLPDGSKFVLKAAYDWSPLAKIIPGDVAERINEQGMSVEFEFHGGRREKIPGSFEKSQFQQAGKPEQLCSRAGVIHNTIVGWGSFRKDTGEVIDVPPLPDDLRPSVQENVPSIKTLLTRIDGEFVSTKYFIDGDLIVYESAFAKRDCGVKRVGYFPNPCPIVLVISTVSHDGGLQWSVPILTSEPKIFEIGRSVLEQSFIARPISINGKKVEAHFPPPQTREERERFLASQPKREVSFGK